MPELPVHETEFIKITKNHQELGAKLNTLHIAAPDLQAYAIHVASCWFRLAKEHLTEAKAALAAKGTRSAYSRAYYAAYNASKGVRYFVSGVVSLKGDDHGKAGPDLPSDISDVETWSKNISELYEHRLRADYDNWDDTAKQNTLSPEDAIGLAENFIDVVQHYMNDKYGIAL